MSEEDASHELAREVLGRLRAANERVATAESFTGGRLAGTLTAVPGASDCVAGGVVAYAADAKVEELGVRRELLAERGTVDERVAEEMARGVRDRFGTTWGVSTTGVAGPDPGGRGEPVGTAIVGIARQPGEGGNVETTSARRHDLPGDRLAIKAGGVERALRDLLAALDPDRSA